MSVVPPARSHDYFSRVHHNERCHPEKEARREEEKALHILSPSHRFFYSSYVAEQSMSLSKSGQFFLPTKYSEHGKEEWRGEEER